MGDCIKGSGLYLLRSLARWGASMLREFRRTSSWSRLDKTFLVFGWKLNYSGAPLILAFYNNSFNQDIYPGWFFRIHVDTERLGEDAADMLCRLQCASTVWVEGQYIFGGVGVGEGGCNVFTLRCLPYGEWTWLFQCSVFSHEIQIFLDRTCNFCFVSVLTSAR